MLIIYKNWTLTVFKIKDFHLFQYSLTSLSILIFDICKLTILHPEKKLLQFK